MRLAARLGVDRPDRLDQLVLLPEQVTEAKLEQLFGLQDTTRDPLVRGPKPLLLTWQLDRLRAQWQEQDNAARVYGDISVPIIDPDLLAETDFRTRNKDADPAFALWNARTAEMTALLKQIDDLRKSKSTPLAGFDAVVGQFVATVEDLTALLADYQAGKDIAPRLTEKRLSLAAFLRLMRSRDLAVAGTVLDADWADVYAIAAQVTKLGRYPTWRAEEQAKGLTLGPDYFVLPDPTTPLVELPEWRATLQARRAWQAIAANADQPAARGHPGPACGRRRGRSGSPPRAARPARRHGRRCRTRPADRPGRRRRAADQPPRPGDRDPAGRAVRGARRCLHGGSPRGRLEAGPGLYRGRLR